MDRYTQTKRIIFTGMVIVPVLPFLIALGIGAYSAVAALEENTSSAIKRIAEDHGDMVDAFLRERQADLEVAISSLSPEFLASDNGLEILYDNLQSASESYTDLGLVAPDGRQAAYAGPYSLINADYSGKIWYENVLKNGSAVSDLFTGYRGAPHFIVAVARTIKGKTWVLRATVNQRIFDELVENVRLGETGEAFVVNSAGRLQTEPRSGGALLDQVPADQLHSVDSRVYKAMVKGNPCLCVAVPINNGRWRMIVRRQKWEALAPLRNATWIMLGVLIAGFGGITGLAAVASGRIAQSLRTADETRESLERQLIMASRLAELGEMAAGFAHEINNPLQVMKSDLTLMEMTLSDVNDRAEHAVDTEEMNELLESLDQIRTQISRCAAITSAILKFGRHGERNPKHIDLASYLPQVAGMVAKKAQVSGIDLRMDVPSGTGRVYADEGELQQVILNLLNNAIHAVCDQHGVKGGIISVQAETESSDTVRITVEDNGVGIASENLERIFAPFFTTKPQGKGTGLGLSVCYGIIDRMGGSMDVQSEKGSGTRFIIHLPAV